METVGLLGGTFNPIHCGHLRAAIEVRERCGLSRVIVIPASVPYHKANSGVVPAELRLRMAAEAVAGLEGVEYSDVEILRGGASYTIDTWDYYRTLLGPKVDLKLILGKEVFLQIHTWYRFEELMERATFIITNRPDGSGCGPNLIQEYVATTLAAYSPNIETVSVPELNISSSNVRAKVKNGQSIRFLVPDVVANIITEEGLYI